MMPRLPIQTFTKLFTQQFRGPALRNTRPSFYSTMMRAARYYGIEDIRVEQVPQPTVRPGQVKVQKPTKEQRDRTIYSSQ